MTKVILMSIKPKHLENILNGKKTIIIHKNKLPLGIPVYLYCTKDKNNLLFDTSFMPDDMRSYTYYCRDKEKEDDGDILLNGKVVAKVEFSRHSVFGYGCMDYDISDATFDEPYRTQTIECGDGYWITVGELENSCLTYKELEEYGKGKDLFGHFISKLEIFDKPMELSDFYTKATVKDFDLWLLESDYFDFSYWKRITRAPKSWQYAWTRK